MKVTTALILLAALWASPANAEPILELTPAELIFTGDVDVLELTISNAGDGVLEWEAEPLSFGLGWLAIDLTSGTGDATITVTVDRTGLSSTTYFGGIAVTSNGGDGSVGVELYVSSTPILNVSPTGLFFNPSSPSQQSFDITNLGAATLSWSVASSDPWINVLPPTSGSGPATITVEVDVNALEMGIVHSGDVFVTSNGGNSSVYVGATPPVAASGGTIGLYAEPEGLTCAISDDAEGVVAIYVVHKGLANASAAEFAAPVPSCMSGATWLNDTRPFPVTLGTSQIGAAVAYGTCLNEPVHIMTINLFGLGMSELCCEYPVVEHPAAGGSNAVDCADNLIAAIGVGATVNATGACSCGTVKTEETTWGRLKSIYQTD